MFMDDFVSFYLLKINVLRRTVPVIDATSSDCVTVDKETVYNFYTVLIENWGGAKV